jgi:ferredoxin
LSETTLPAAEFVPFRSKRTLIRSSAAHLAACAPGAPTVVDLPAGAPFGAVLLDGTACTLCMACCGACPTGALGTTGDAPELHLLESECIQCGRCRQTCPEQALVLAPQLVWDPVRAERPRRLYAQEAMACIRCGRPFAPPGLVARLRERLEGHWMYQREEDRRRLSMCRDCRLRDLFSRSREEER